MSDKVVVGKFGAPHGVRGEIKVYSFTDPIKNILNYLPWQIKPNRNSDWQTLDILKHRWHNKILLVTIPGIDDRDIVKTYTNIEIAIDREQMPEPDEDEYYWSDLMGLTVITVDDVELGILKNHLETGADDVMVVIKDGVETLIPYTKQVVKNVDLGEKRITVDWEPL